MRRLGFCVMLGLMFVLLDPTRGISQLPGGSSGGGSRGSMFGDPSKLFDILSGGKDVASKDSLPNPWLGKMFDGLADKMGVTNGVITRDQFTSYMQQQMAGKAAGPAPAGTPAGGPAADGGSSRSGGFRGGDNGDMTIAFAESMFRRADANGDGFLNYDEMSENLRIERDKWDENKDGVIDLNEYTAFFKAAMQQRMNEAGSRFGMGDAPAGKQTDPDDEDEPKPVVYRAGKLPKELPSWWKTADGDNDGQITMAEWRSTGKSLDEYQKLDRNGDGFVTIAEVMFSVQGKNYLNGVAINAPTPTDPRASDPGRSSGGSSRGGGSGGLADLFSRFAGGGMGGGPPGGMGGGPSPAGTAGPIPSDGKTKGGPPTADGKSKGFGKGFGGKQ